MTDFLLSPFQKLMDLGGPVLLLLAAMSLVSSTLVFYKLWQFRSARIGRQKSIRVAAAQWDTGQAHAARNTLEGSDHCLARVYLLGTELEHPETARPRLEAEAEQALLPLERGFRVLDTIAQLAPLLGLFGTVLGMIEAFQALQQAGSQVDPSVLAGGIWVALLTTAAGLAVAMPTSVALSWFEGQLDAERVLANLTISTLLAPSAQTVAAPVKDLARHGA